MPRRFASLLALAAILSPAAAHAAEITKHAPDAVAAHIQRTLGCGNYMNHEAETSSLYCAPRKGIALQASYYPSNDGSVFVSYAWSFKAWSQAESTRTKAELRGLLDFMFEGETNKAAIDTLVADFASPKVAWRSCGTGCDAFVSKKVARPGFEYRIELIYK